MGVQRFGLRVDWLAKGQTLDACMDGMGPRLYYCTYEEMGLRVSFRMREND